MLFEVSFLDAQTQEIEAMWRNRKDKDPSDFVRPAYLKISEDSLSALFDNQPSFGMYRDNYFVTGIPTNEKVTKSTADAKFQISISQRLTKTTLPFNTFLMLTYTQKSFWNVYEKSSPFTDNNYNPALLLGKPLVFKNEFKGMAYFSIEHESNGQGDSLRSRSWDYLALSGSYFFNKRISGQLKIWAGHISDDNPDLLKYKGYGFFALNYRSANDRFWVSAVLNPCKNFTNLNTQLELNVKLNKKHNQYFFIQWYQGYAESLLNYDKYTSMVRAGVCIKPVLRNLY
jgi:phospholipase A1